jgi:hypothetical protein
MRAGYENDYADDSKKDNNFENNDQNLGVVWVKKSELLPIYFSPVGGSARLASRQILSK